MRARRRRPRGFTLVELMIAVLLVGVLSTAAIALLRSSPRAIDVASQLSAKISEASRKAVAGGSVRDDVLVALGSSVPANQARTLVSITVGATGGGTVSVAQLEEDPLPANTASWVTLSSTTLHRAVTLDGFRTGATLTSVTAPETALAAGATLEIRCYPDGSCDGMVIYTSSTRGARKARVVVMPLGGSPLTFDSW